METEAAGRSGDREEENQGENSEEDEPDNTSGKEAAEKIGRPEDGDSRIKWEERKKEEAAVGEAGKMGAAKEARGRFRRGGLS